MTDKQVLDIAKQRAFPLELKEKGISKLTYVATQIFCAHVAGNHRSTMTIENQVSYAVDDALTLIKEISERQGFDKELQEETNEENV